MVQKPVSNLGPVIVIIKIVVHKVKLIVHPFVFELILLFHFFEFSGGYLELVFEGGVPVLLL